MGDGPGKAVELPNSHYIELAPVGVGHEPVERRAFVLRSADPFVDVLPRDRPSSAGCVFLQFPGLQVHVLTVIACRDTRVNCASLR